jgi:hypothetical protein
VDTLGLLQQNLSSLSTHDLVGYDTWGQSTSRYGTNPGKIHRYYPILAISYLPFCSSLC